MIVGVTSVTMSVTAVVLVSKRVQCAAGHLPHSGVFCVDRNSYGQEKEPGISNKKSIQVRYRLLSCPV